MDLQDCIKFATEQRTAYVATDDNGQPRVRPLALWFADEGGFYFQSWLWRFSHGMISRFTLEKL